MVAQQLKYSGSHRERMERCLAGKANSRPPVALWRHFPVDDQSPGSLAAATVEFQKSYDFDFVKVTPASSFCLRDWGVKDEWRGAVEGTREYTQRVIHQPEDWTKFSALDPRAGILGNQIECLKMIVSELGPDVPVIQTIFNPLSQAKNLAGQDRLLVHLRKYPDLLQEGLKVIVETTLAFMEAAKQTGIAGFFYAVQHAQFQMLSLNEYREFGKSHDLTLLSSGQDLWLNVLHLHGENIMFEEFSKYPVGIINWHDRDTAPSLSEGLEQFPGIVCGGLRRQNTMVLGTPEDVMTEAREAIESVNGQRFVLGTGCVVPTIAPRANLRAARLSVEQ
jgi:uroporphyrinogen decarboxylase